MTNDSSRSVGVSIVAFSPNGRFIAAGGQNGQIKLWRFENRPLEEKTVAFEEGARITGLSISPNSRYLLAVDTEQRIRLWEITSANLIQEFYDNDDPYLCATFTHRSEQIASIKHSGEISITDWSSAKVVRVQYAAPGNIRKVGVSPNGLYLAVGYQNGGACLLGLETEKPVKPLRSTHPILSSNEELSVWINNVRFSHDSEYLVVGGNTVAVWSSSTGDLVASFLNETHTLGSSLLTPDNQYLLVLAVDNDQHVVRVYDFHTRELIRCLMGITDFTDALDCSHDGQFILTGSYDGTVRVWDFKSNKELFTITF